MKQNRYEIEQAVAETISDFAYEYDLPQDFYGDCYPAEIMELENRMETMTDDEVTEALEQLQKDLEKWYL